MTGCPGCRKSCSAANSALVSTWISCRNRAEESCVAGQAAPKVRPYLAEYREVLSRSELSIPGGAAGDLLDFVRHRAERVDAALLSVALPDESDRPFLEVAAACEAVLVTGNLRHFPGGKRGNVRVVSPREFLELLRQSAR